MKKIVKKIFRIFGIEIKKIKKSNIVFYNDFDHNMNYEFEKAANDAVKIVRKQTMLPYVNLITLYEQVMYCEKNNIEGDFVECGVWKGGAVGLMALANLKHGSDKRRLHLFDAFEEICAPDAKNDGEFAVNEVKRILGNKAPIKGELVPLKGIYDQFGGPSSIEDCKNLLQNIIGYPSEYTFYHKGWFQNTIPADAAKIEKIAILRLDGDWYESTKISLDYLWDKVVPGGFIILDDYGLYEGCKKAVDEFLLQKKLHYYLNYSSWACRYIIK